MKEGDTDGFKCISILLIFLFSTLFALSTVPFMGFKPIDSLDVTGGAENVFHIDKVIHEDSYWFVVCAVFSNF